MGYSKVNNTNKKSVTYLNKNYNDFKQSLVDYAKNYFPDAVNDFSEASPGTMFIEMASYVGDVLSFYLDTQIQENFIQYARERENLYSLAYNLGYVPAITNPSSVTLDVYQQIPAKVVGETTLPDFDYALNIFKKEKTDYYLISSYNICEHNIFYYGFLKSLENIQKIVNNNNIDIYMYDLYYNNIIKTFLSKKNILNFHNNIHYYIYNYNFDTIIDNNIITFF